MTTCDGRVVLLPGTSLRVAKNNSRRVVTLPGRGSLWMSMPPPDVGDMNEDEKSFAETMFGALREPQLVRVAVQC